jgi:hypothetical protein
VERELSEVRELHTRELEEKDDLVRQLQEKVDN